MSFWRLFRIVFIVFFLYLLGDTFFRWDGFRYYGTLSEFIPAVALISVIWFMLAVIAALFLWFILLLFVRVLRVFKFNLHEGHLIIFGLMIFFLGVLTWWLKNNILSDVNATFVAKFITFVAILFSSLGITFLLRSRADEIVNGLNKRLTPLVGLFGIIVTLSIPIVVYNMTLSDEKVSTEVGKASNIADRKPNIILVTFDALAAENMSLYGYHRETTPFIDKWAKNATVFVRAEADSNYTAPTTATLMTGKRVWTHRRFQSEGHGVFKAETENLPLLLKLNGYSTMAFIANDLASVERLGISEGFIIKPSFSDFMSPSSIFGFLRKYLYKFFGKKISFYFWALKEDFILNIITPDYEYFKFPVRLEFPIDRVFDIFFSRVRDTNQPFFAWIHLFPPHAPYLPPKEYTGLFEPQTKFRRWSEQLQIIKPRYFSKTQQRQVNELMARYDEFIMYCDGEFKNFIIQLERIGLSDNTVIILSADHGESFEHGYLTHGGPLLFEQMTHIPLVIKEQGQGKGRFIDLTVEQIDIPATILDYAGITVPSWMEGRSLRPLLEGSTIEPKPVFSMQLEKNLRGDKITKGTIAVWKGDYKLIHDLEKNESLLFNIKEDPDELNNLFDKERDVGQYLLNLIKEELKKANEKIINSGVVKN